MRGSWILALVAVLGITSRAAPIPTSYDAARVRLVQSFRGFAEALGEQDDSRVVRAMTQVPRHQFVPASSRVFAYEDRPLAIGREQTISQPSLVALMTQALHPRSGDVMLEVGTGSGYQAAILSGLVRRVYSIEIVAPLARQSSARLRQLGYSNVEVRHGDGYLGWPEHAPFDGIVVTAGADHVPKPLVEQLKPGGRMVIPVGSARSEQELLLITKNAVGQVRRQVITAVRFVPLTRDVRE